jgi:predicted RNA-binding Zn-ribbon protein involved in translation (DUF1610 family)
MRCPAIGRCNIEVACGDGYGADECPPCASKNAESAPSASPNSASTKLPPKCSMCKHWGNVLTFFFCPNCGRQLRAGG